MVASGKHSSLLYRGINYDEKKVLEVLTQSWNGPSNKVFSEMKNLDKNQTFWKKNVSESTLKCRWTLVNDWNEFYHWKFMFVSCSYGWEMLTLFSRCFKKYFQPLATFFRLRTSAASKLLFAAMFHCWTSARTKLEIVQINWS